MAPDVVDRGHPRVLELAGGLAWELDEDGEIDWLDEWEDELTNKIPTVVEVTLYVDAAQEGEDPIEMKRIIGLRLGALAWK